MSQGVGSRAEIRQTISEPGSLAPGWDMPRRQTLCSPALLFPVDRDASPCRPRKRKGGDRGVWGEAQRDLGRPDWEAVKQDPSPLPVSAGGCDRERVQISLAEKWGRGCVCLGGGLWEVPLLICTGMGLVRRWGRAPVLLCQVNF